MSNITVISTATRPNQGISFFISSQEFKNNRQSYIDNGKIIFFDYIIRGNKRVTKTIFVSEEAMNEFNNDPINIAKEQARILYNTENGIEREIIIKK